MCGQIKKYTIHTTRLPSRDTLCWNAIHLQGSCQSKQPPRKGSGFKAMVSQPTWHICPASQMSHHSFEVTVATEVFFPANEMPHWKVYFCLVLFHLHSPGASKMFLIKPCFLSFHSYIMTQLIIGSMKLKAVGLWTDQSRVSSGTLSPHRGCVPSGCQT